MLGLPVAGRAGSDRSISASMMRKKSVILPVVVLLLAACSSQQFGQPGRPAWDNSADQDQPKEIFDMAKTNGQSVRPPFAAGTFYPAGKGSLDALLDKLFSAAPPLAAKRARALIVPHAGYEYSGAVAARVFGQLRGQSYRRVFLLGSAHAAYFSGAALDDSSAWKTPFGQVNIDQIASAELNRQDKEVVFLRSAQAADHVLENQLPFLQKILDPTFQLVPILIGQTDEKTIGRLADTLDALLTGDDLLVVSSDLSHYPAYEDANQVDQRTLALIAALDEEGLLAHAAASEEKIAQEETAACGLAAIQVLIRLIQKKGWQSGKYFYANSGDIAGGDRGRVVGYGAMLWAEPEKADYTEAEKGQPRAELNDEEKNYLLALARQTLEKYLASGEVMEFAPERAKLKEPRGAFVTLHEDGRLRGCIGQIIPTGAPLWQVVRDMAIAAATEDNRFEPADVGELKKIDLEISVLSVPQAIADWRGIELGRHGVIVKKNGWPGGVFLPQVAQETGWTREEFLGELCEQKAGWPRDCYRDKNVTLEVFTAQVFGEKNQ